MEACSGGGGRGEYELAVLVGGGGGIAGEAVEYPDPMDILANCDSNPLAPEDEEGGSGGGDPAILCLISISEINLFRSPSRALTKALTSRLRSLMTV